MSETHPLPEPLIVVLSTVPSAEVGQEIARELVEARLAACVNMIPGLVSTYSWKGKIQRDDEALLVIKTRAAQFDALAAALTATHPYDVPEIVALPVEACHGPYAAWLVEATRSSSS